MPNAIDELECDSRIHTAPCGEGRLVLRRWPAVGSPAAAPPVVLVHGGSGSWTHWLATIPALRSMTDVWTVDLPGLGDSDMPPPPHTPAHCGRILANGLTSLVIDSAGRRNGAPHLVGFSFGAHVSTYAAAMLGHGIRDLTIVGSSALGLPHPPHMPPFPKERSGMTAAERREVHRRTLEILMIADPSRIDDLAIDIQERNVARARFRSREFALTDDIKQQLAHVSVPVSAIWGERDVLAYPSLDHVRAALAHNQPALRWRTVPDAGHWVMYEQPERFSAALIETLGLHRSAS